MAGRMPGGNYQDWEEVSFKKRGPKPSGKGREKDANVARQQGQQVEAVKKFNAGTNKRGGPAIDARKLEADDEDGPAPLPKVDRSMAQKIQQARQAKKMTQKELATAINEQPKVVQEYEQGKAIPNQQVISRMERALGTKLRGK